MSKYKKELNKTQYKQMLDDICEDYCNEKSCILKAFLLSSHPSSKLMTQMKCADKFRAVVAERRGVAVGEVELSEAMEVWIEEGYASLFAEVYEEGLRYDTIYRTIIELSENR